jgi:hypothetical protein
MFTMIMHYNNFVKILELKNIIFMKTMFTNAKK